MKKTETFKEAQRLYRLGFAIHWLHPKSKRPVESGWTTGPRKDWDYLKETYHENFNIGVRLGTPSKIGEGYLTVVDVDVKSTDKRHREEAVAAAKSLLKGIKCPAVSSGRGNGSRHYYCLTKEPFKTFNPAESTEEVKVMMPSKKPSKRELATLSEAEIAQGLRLARAWEISLYSDGRQVVLPPSIHPDTNKPYSWTSPLLDSSSLPMIEFEMPATEIEEVDFMEPSKKKSQAGEVEAANDFEVEEVDLAWLPISDKMRSAIIDGTGVNDRSAFLLPAATALVSAGLSKNEILSVLTDSKTFLGACGYDHAKTTSRKRAALWVWKYTVKRVMQERDAVAFFKAAPPVEQPSTLDESGTKAQADEIEEESDWRQYLESTKHGEYKPTLHNCRTILTHVCGTPAIVGRNEFAANDFYLVNTPWRSKKGEAVVDVDIVRIKFFCVEQFGVEFSDHTINQALIEIADKNRFHPVRDWLKTLKWDGVERIDTWLKDFAGAEAPEPYLSNVSRKLLVAMVARVFKPGIKFDQIVILEGNQGTGKSTLLRKLVGDEWFSDAPLNIGDKDAILTMQSKWLIEVGELGALNKAEVETFKSFISQQVDRIRAPYGKRIEEHPRQCVVLGTTNSDEYLRDLTGNRRFWVVKTVGRIDFREVERIREQLFAEAVAYYRLGEPLYLEDAEASEQAAGEQAKRMQSDEWLPAVRDIVEFETFPRDGFEMREVAKKMDSLGAHRLSPTDVHRISRCLKLLGFERFQEPSGERRKLWRVATGEFMTKKNGSVNLDPIHGSKSKFGAVAQAREAKANGTTAEPGRTASRGSINSTNKIEHLGNLELRNHDFF